MSGKIKISLDDPETRAVWESAQNAKREVATWPAWKRGDATCPRCERTHAVNVRDNTCPHCSWDYHKAFADHLHGRSANWVGVLPDWWRPYEPCKEEL